MELENMCDEDLAEPSVDDIASDISLEKDFQIKERNEIIRNAINSLGEKYSIALKAFYLEQLSCEEVAKKYEIGLSNVRTLLKRGRAKLKEKLKEVGFNNIYK